MQSTVIEFYRKSNYLVALSLLLILQLFFLPLTIRAAEESQKPLKVYKASLEQVFKDINLENTVDMAWDKDKLFLLESSNHRISIIKDNQPSGQIGQIGQKDGDFYYPRAFALDNNKNFYVVDYVGKTNERLQVLDPQGSFRAGFTIESKSWGFAIDSKGNVLLGQPHAGALVSVYSTDGKIIHGVGNLLRPSDVYGEKYQRYDKTYRYPMNRVNLSVDEKDNIWVSFLFMPVVMKFDAQGQLIFKKIIETPGMEPLKKVFWERGSKEAQKYLSRNIDGYQMTVMTKDIIYDARSHQTYLLLGSDEILVLSSSGEARYIIRPDFIKGALERFFLDAAGDIIVRFFFHPECYKLNYKIN